MLRQANLTLGDGASSVHVLKGIDLDISGGQSVGIVGPSGSGKSTLLMVVAGLERLDTGEVHVAGHPLHSLDEDAVAAVRGSSIGIVFQSFHLIPNMTALENVAVPLELAGRADAFERAREELVAVGLGERLTHYPGQLSGGEQQRVAIARALAPDPALIVADEPTGNLDGDTGRQIADLLFAKQAERGATLLLVTHDPSLASRCNRQVSVRSGLIVDDSAGAIAGNVKVSA
ncbi:MAG: ABC transporter ATP-binding protein [Hoeflea sp.]|uniref:ABC transporter ATP-binding protein n=1 Tax=Hoeflea sp. TaxID=1940281 RepID=UPI0032F04DA2